MATLTEIEIRKLCHKLNQKIISVYSLHKNNALPVDITSEQTYKGLAWLIKMKSKKCSAFGDRENNIVENFAKFQLITFKDIMSTSAQSYGNHQYVPVYRVYDNNKNFFDYYYDFINIKITG